MTLIIRQPVPRGKHCDASPMGLVGSETPMLLAVVGFGRGQQQQQGARQAVIPPAIRCEGKHVNILCVCVCDNLSEAVTS